MELLDLTDLQATAQPFVKVPVIYFLFRDGELLYVGQSKNFHFRMGTHACGRGRREFDSYSSVIVPDGVDPEELEKLYIAKLKPKQNRAGRHPSEWEPYERCDAIPNAMAAFDNGMSIRTAAKQEGISEQTLRTRIAWRKRGYTE